MSLLYPQNDCTVTKNGGVDRHGKPVMGASYAEKCSIVMDQTAEQHTTVRADSSGSRGYAWEFAAKAKILLLPTTQAKINDKLDVAGVSLQITGMFPRYDVFGELDHYEVTGSVWA